MTTTKNKGKEFEIAAEVAELLDTFEPEQQRQVKAMLATRYDLTLKDPAASPCWVMTRRDRLRP